MWFKNLKIFRLNKDWRAMQDGLEILLKMQVFQPGNRSDMQNMGWAPTCGGGLVLALGSEKKRQD